MRMQTVRANTYRAFSRRFSRDVNYRQLVGIYADAVAQRRAELGRVPSP